jgi:hypothetical protein
VLAAVHPLIRPGDILTWRDCAHQPLPGDKQRVWSRIDGSAAAADPNGVLLYLPARGSGLFVDEWVRVRDACVRAGFTLIQGSAQVGVMLRREIIGEGARTFYALDVWPDRRTVRLARCFSSEDEAGATPLFGWAESPCVAPPGSENQLELRAQAATLEAWVNGTRIAVVHDPVFGIGRSGIRVVAAQTEPARILCRGFEVRGVAS